MNARAPRGERRHRSPHRLHQREGRQLQDDARVQRRGLLGARDRKSVVDLDPQGQLGKVLGVEVGAARRTALNLLLDALLGEETRPALPIIRARHPNLDIIPSNKSLALFPQEAAEHPGDENHCLRDALERAPAYDFVLFDAPPSFGVITLNALLASSEIVLPVPLTWEKFNTGDAPMMRVGALPGSRIQCASYPP